jgi:hypothetical protein
MFGWRGNKGGVEGREEERFNKPYLRGFLSEREKDLRGVKGIRYHPNPSF